MAITGGGAAEMEVWWTVGRMIEGGEWVWDTPIMPG